MCSHIEQRFYLSRNKNFKSKFQQVEGKKIDFLRQPKDNKYMRKNAEKTTA